MPYPNPIHHGLFWLVYPTLYFAFRQTISIMPGKVTHFQKDWLKEKDENGHILSLWCKQGTVDAALCIFCNKYVKHDNQALPQLANPTCKRVKT